MSGTILLFAVYATFPLAAFGLSWIAFTARVREWLRAAEEIGFEPRRATKWGFVLRAASRELSLSLDGRFLQEEQISRVRVVMRARVVHDPSLGLEIGPLSWLEAAGLGRGVASRTGDPWFDGTVLTAGRADALLAALDESTRRELVDLARLAKIHFIAGELTAIVDESQASDRRGLLDRFARMTLHLAGPRDVATELARIATEDRLPDVRRRALEALADFHPGAAETAATVESALGDLSAAVRLVAARASGETGEAVLLGLTADPKVEDVVAAEALRVLGKKIEPELLTRILTDARARGRGATAIAAIESLARSRAVLAREPLESALVGEGWPISIAAAKALASLAFPESMPLLAERLGVAPIDEARALVGGLERGGDLATIPTLRAAAVRHAWDRAFARQVELAVRTIQGRVPGAGAGQISLADDGAGRLSLPRAEAGRLALAGPGAPPEQPT